MEESGISESIISEVINYFFLRKFEDRLQILDISLESRNNNIDMWKLIIHAKQGQEKILTEAKKLHERT